MHRLRKRVEVHLLRQPVRVLATLNRRRLTRPVFMGITGTAGKTTTNELTAAVLSRLGPGVKSEDGYNTLRHVVKCLLRTTQRHRYCVQELGAPAPGALDELVKCFRPDVGVVLNVGLEHYSAYRAREAVALEKGRMVEILPSTGTAILNADDPHVAAMRERTKANVITFGLSDHADVRAENVSSVWPQPLRLDAVDGDHRQPIETQLHGEHWVYAVLAALSVGRCLGVFPQDAAAAIAGMSPVAGRLDTVTTPQGISFLCDDYKFPFWNVDTFLRVVERANAKRKLVVFGNMSDSPGNSGKKFRRIAHQTLDVADVVLVVGESAVRYLKRMGEESDRLVLCERNDDAREYLNRHLGAGDLVVLKGTYKIGDLRCVAGADSLV